VRSGTGPQPANAGAGGVSWLVDEPRPSLPDGGTNAGDAGRDGGDAGDAAAPPLDPANANTVRSGPDNLLSQLVQVAVPGTYLLSWWDQARDPKTGQPTSSSGMPAPAVPYRAEVFDSRWQSMAGFDSGPAQSDATGTGWSARRVLSFKVVNPGLYRVTFAASASPASPGSVAIANVQLERAPVTGQPSDYVDTGGTGDVTQYQCALSADDLRAAFVRNCDPDGTCYYDLQTPITINTQTFTSNGLSLAGKLAKGNYNFRHVDVAVNFVGTGIIDCSQTGSPDCNGSGYLSYQLTDDGTNVGVLGWDKQYRRFNFGTATIDHGKALTAERYITTPLGSDDQALVSQFRKIELRGRPIDGTYFLRLYDSPVLHFDHIEDIQLVLNYHYWSRIIAPQNN
jgi:hypothetical protein